MSKRKRSSKHAETQGLRAANPGLFNSPPGAEWESRGLLNKTPDPNRSTGFIYQFPIPVRFPKDWHTNIPPISFGENAPVPRWRFASDPTKPAQGKDLEKDLVRTVAGKSVIDGVASGSHPRSFDSSIGLGGLKWVFDPGLPANTSNLLHGEKLYEMAHNYLTDALQNPISRTQMRREIANGPLWPKVCNVEDPLPPPPERPKTNFYTDYRADYRDPNAQVESDDYKRAAPKPRARGSTPAEVKATTHADRLLYHEQGADGPLHLADPRKILGIEHDSSDDEGRKEGKIAKIGEYKCVWLCVILLVLSMFLCLFLYSFGIIKVI
jgi:hypothetical protein